MTTQLHPRYLRQRGRAALSPVPLVTPAWKMVFFLVLAFSSRLMSRLTRLMKNEICNGTKNNSVLGTDGPLDRFRSGTGTQKYAKQKTKNNSLFTNCILLSTMLDSVLQNTNTARGAQKAESSEQSGQ